MRDFRQSNRSGGYGGGGSYGGGSSYGGGNRRFGGDRPRPQMFDATCDNCGKNCQVPFRPSGEKPVYCDDCFREQPGREQRGRDNFRSSRPDSGVRHFGDSGSGLSDIKKQLSDLNSKLDKVLTVLGAAPVEEEDAPKAESETPSPSPDAASTDSQVDDFLDVLETTAPEATAETQTE